MAAIMRKEGSGSDVAATALALATEGKWQWPSNGSNSITMGLMVAPLGSLAETAVEGQGEFGTRATNESIAATDTQQPTVLATSMGALLMSLFLVGGLFGNLLIIGSILSTPKVRNVTNTFIVSLCINDVTALLLVVALIVDSYVWRGWNAGDVMCRLNPELNVMLTGSSMWHAALIAVHRYIVVVHNDDYKRMSRTPVYAVFVLVAARAIPLACAVPGFSLDTSGYAPKMLRCVLLPTQAWRMMTVMLVGTVTPCLVVAICYSVVFCVVCRVARRARGGGTDARMRRELKITKMFATAFGAILLGYVPYAVVRNADRDNNFHADVYVFVSVFYGAATCINPLIYGAMSTQVKDACLSTLHRLLLALGVDRLPSCKGSCCGLLLVEKGGTTGLDMPNDNTLPLVAATARNCNNGLVERLQLQRADSNGVQ